MFLHLTARTRRSRRPLAAAVMSLAGLAVSATATMPVGAQAPDPSPGFTPPPASNHFPVPLPYAASFGDDWHACRDDCSRRHKGNDIFAAEGTPEVAVESGVIAQVDDTDDSNGGLSLWLLGDSGVAYYYAHNSANLVVEGQRVARGQVIGRVGRTGNARTTPPHIHFQINECGELSSDEPCTIDPRHHLLDWSQAFVDGGPDALGWYRSSDSTVRLLNEGGSALPAVPVADPAPMGRPAELPVAGDWDGDGRDTVAIYRLPQGSADVLDPQGAVTDRVHLGGGEGGQAFPVAGDWDGDGRDTFGLYLPARGAFVLHHEHGRPTTLALGPVPGADARPVAGDWNGDGRDTFGLYLRARGEFLLAHDEATTTTVRLGPVGARDTFPVAGDWNGDGRDTVGIYRRRLSTFLLDDRDVGAPAPIDGGLPASTEPREVAVGRPGQADALPVAGDWNGRDLVTLDDLRQIYHPRDADPVAASLPFLNAAMLQAGATTPARKAAFLATIRNESGFRADAVEPGRDRYRGRGFVQLTGAPNYQRAGADLGLDLAREPELAANPLVSAAVASWYWTAARDINRAADQLDMAAVGIAVGYAPTPGEDAERCRDFVAALRHFDAGQAADAVNCERTPLSYLLALERPSSAHAASAQADDLSANGPPSPSTPTTTETHEPVGRTQPPPAQDDDTSSSDSPGRPATAAPGRTAGPPTTEPRISRPPDEPPTSTPPSTTPPSRPPTSAPPSTTPPSVDPPPAPSPPSTCCPPPTSAPDAPGPGGEPSPAPVPPMGPDTGEPPPESGVDVPPMGPDTEEPPPAEPGPAIPPPDQPEPSPSTSPGSSAPPASGRPPTAPPVRSTTPQGAGGPDRRAVRTPCPAQD